MVRAAGDEVIGHLSLVIREGPATTAASGE
jgi:hypothetical protein